MSEKKDEEYYALKLINIVKVNLNTKIAEINTRKNDSITLDSVNSNAYYYLTFGQKLPAYDPVIIFTVGSELQGEAGGLTSEKISLAIEMVITDKLVADSLTLYKKIVRYRRALKEILSENYSSFHGFRTIILPDVGFTVGAQACYSLGVGVEFSFSN